MLNIDLISPMEKYDWIIPIIIQSNKKTKDIKVYFDYQILNFAFVHDPFLTPFNNEVLDQVVGNEDYSFTNGFLGYNQVQIIEEDNKKETSTTNMESFSYNVIPFGPKNASAMFFRIVI